MDAYVTAQFMRGEDRVTTATFQLHHNSLSHRHWVDVKGRNLYLGNGRVRHESYTIRQGPFQLLRLTSLQATKESEGTVADLEVGGKNHIEITVFRNREIFGEADSFRRYGPLDIGIDGMASHLEASKRGMLDEFLRVVAGERHGLLGTLESHRASITMLSLMYRAAARRLGGGNELLRMPSIFDPVNQKSSSKVDSLAEDEGNGGDGGISVQVLQGATYYTQFYAEELKSQVFSAEESEGLYLELGKRQAMIDIRATQRGSRELSTLPRRVI
jgi:hypothetical protein